MPEPDELPNPGDVRVSPDGDAYADYTPSKPSDYAPWTLRTCDHRYITRVTHKTVEDWQLAGHLSDRATGQALPDELRVRVFCAGDPAPSAEVMAVCDRHGDVWSAHEWDTGTTPWHDLVRLTGPLIEVPIAWLMQQMRTHATSHRPREPTAGQH